MPVASQCRSTSSDAWSATLYLFWTAATSTSGGVDAVQIIQVDPFDLEPPETHLDALPQVLRPPTWCPLVRALASQTALGSDDQALGVGVQRLADVLLGR